MGKKHQHSKQTSQNEGKNRFKRTYDYKTFSKHTKSCKNVKLYFCPNTEHLTKCIPSTLSMISTYTKTKPTSLLALLTLKSIQSKGLFLKLLETGIGGKTFNLISTKNNTCAVKKGNKLISFLGVRKGCPLSPTRFSIYLNELAKELNNATAPGPNLTESEINCFLFADDLVILSTQKSDYNSSWTS